MSLFELFDTKPTKIQSHHGEDRPQKRKIIEYVQNRKKKTKLKKDQMVYNGHVVPITVNTSVLPLNIKNAFARDKDIAFSEKYHVYYVKGRCNGWISVSKLCKKYFQPFNANRTARQMVSRKDFKTHIRYSKYAHFWQNNPLITNPDLCLAITASWTKNGQTQSKLGTELHDWVERMLNDVLSPTELQEGIDNYPERGYAHQYVKDRENDGWVPFRTEVMVYDSVIKLSGMVDALFKDKLGHIRMVDWKRSKEIRTTGFSNQMGVQLCSGLPDCNQSHYFLQLNMYKYVLETYYEIEIYSMQLVVFHPSNNNYIIVEVPDMQKLIHNIFKQRKLDIT
jgi:hypothetical protein